MGRVREEKHKTSAGIDWIGNSLTCAAKIALTRFGRGYVERLGYDPNEIADLWDVIIPGSGFMSQRHFRDLEDQMDKVLPEFREYFQEKSTHKGRYGYALAHRARHCLKKDETARFRTQAWAPFFSYVRDAADSGTEVTREGRYACHERLILHLANVLRQSEPCPGVYVNVDPEGTGRFYLGESGDVVKRNLGHRNGGFYLSRVYATDDKKTAVNLQNALFRSLEEMEVLLGVRIPDGKRGAQGSLRIERGLNPVELLDGIVDSRYREFCRQKLGWYHESAR